MNLLRDLTAKILSLSLIFAPANLARAQDRTEREEHPLFYRVKKGDALSEVLDRLLLRPIYPLTGSLRRTIAANPGRFQDLKAPLFPHEKIYFAPSDAIMLRQNNQVLASGEVRIGRASGEETRVAAPLAVVPRTEPRTEKKPEAQEPTAAVEHVKPAPAVAPVPAVVAQKQEPEAPAPAPKKTTQNFPATEDEEGVVKDSFVMEHSRPNEPDHLASPPALAPEPIRRPAAITHKSNGDQPLEQDNYFPMLDSPVAAPRPSDTRGYQSEF